MAGLHTKVKICSINISGMSDRSRFMTDKYSDLEQFDLLTMQEIDTVDEEKLNITNMNVFTDDNSSRNKGIAVYARKKHTFTKLKQLNQISKNIDTSWGVAIMHNKRYIVGSVYMKLNYLQGIQEIISMLNKAHEMKDKLRACGIILTGDLNARHISWGDSTNNAYGQKLVELLDYTKFSICHADTPTFLSTNGSSCIDLMITTNNLVENLEYIRTDNKVELHSGAPFRGHVPLIASFQVNTSSNGRQARATEKINTSNICWEKWTTDLEHELQQKERELENSNDPVHLKNILNKTIELVTLRHGDKKVCSNHSKPYWTNNLTRLCDEMREARTMYNKRNTPTNRERLNQAKELFDDERKKECQDFLIKKTRNLNSTQATRFWKEFNGIFKKKTDQNIDPLIDNEGNLLTDHEDVEEFMFSTFFEGHHIKPGDFDQYFYVETNRLYEEVINDITDEQEINDDITTAEIYEAIKSYKSSGKSSDKETFNPMMFKHLGNKAIHYIEKLANLCLNKGIWIWNKAEVIFLKKSGKDTYSKPGSYRPISISSYIYRKVNRKNIGYTNHQIPKYPTYL